MCGHRCGNNHNSWPVTVGRRGGCAQAIRVGRASNGGRRTIQRGGSIVGGRFVFDDVLVFVLLFVVRLRQSLPGQRIEQCVGFFRLQQRFLQRILLGQNVRRVESVVEVLLLMLMLLLLVMLLVLLLLMVVVRTFADHNILLVEVLVLVLILCSVHMMIAIHIVLLLLLAEAADGLQMQHMRLVVLLMVVMLLLTHVPMEHRIADAQTAQIADTAKQHTIVIGCTQQ